MNEVNDALRDLIDAVGEMNKRIKAKALGAAIGSALGTAVRIYRTDTQIDNMALNEIDTWASQVAEYPVD